MKIINIKIEGCKEKKLVWNSLATRKNKGIQKYEVGKCFWKKTASKSFNEGPFEKSTFQDLIKKVLIKYCITVTNTHFNFF